MAIKKYLDEHGTEKVLKKIKNQIWRGTQEEWDALSAVEKDKYEQAEIIGLDNNGVVYVADKVEENNMNPVTSNAVAKAMNNLFTGTATKSAYVTAGNITWQWVGRICRVLFEGVKLAANMPFLSDICTGLPPANGTEFMSVCPISPTATLAGFLRTDRNTGKLLADNSVGGQPVEIQLYASVSYITSEPAHAI